MNKNIGSIGTVNNCPTNNSTTSNFHQYGITNNIQLTPRENFCEYDSWMRQVGSLIRVSNQYQSIKPFFELLTAVLEPDRIFLFDKSAEANNRCLHLILALDSARFKGFEEITRLLKVSCFRFTNVSFSVHDTEILEQEIVRGHPYYTLRCTEENLIFSGKCYRLPCAPDDVIKRAKDEAVKVFSINIEKAYDIFELAKKCGEKKEELCYEMMVQALSILYKAVLRSFRHAYPLTDDIETLQQEASLYIPILLDKEIFGNPTMYDAKTSSTELSIKWVTDTLLTVHQQFNTIMDIEDKTID